MSNLIIMSVSFSLQGRHLLDQAGDFAVSGPLSATTCRLTLLKRACIFSVLKRFCEIQEDPPSLQEMTYERLKQIVVSYPELSKCPELKVGARCYLGGATFQDFGWNARRGGVILRDQSVLQLCNLPSLLFCRRIPSASGSAMCFPPTTRGAW